MRILQESPARHPASFRDPAGFVFRSADGEFRRQVTAAGRADYRALLDSGLYDELVAERLLIEHEELVDWEDIGTDLILRPRQLTFLSYPYEWAFSALQDAALLTLEIQRRALRRGLWLKDASAFNVQFDGCRPIFIDTLSLAPLRDGAPWPGYAQFCRHFLAPLALMARRDISLGKLLATNLDGIPAALASKLLSRWTWLNPGLAMHLHLLANLERRYAATACGQAAPRTSRWLSAAAHERLADSLSSTIAGLHFRPSRAAWGDYYATHNYQPDEFAAKQRLVNEFLDVVQPRTVWDLGANRGDFSKLASARGMATWSLDSDPECSELAYRDGRERKDTRLVPLTMDLCNPTPALGWAGRERESLAERGPADLALALALIHHLAIGRNVPLDSIIDFLADSARWVALEFVPKSDPQVSRLLRSRDDIFPGYTPAHFEVVASRRFAVRRREPILASGRVLFLLERLPE